MSGIAGILNFNNSPVDENLLAALGESLNARGSDGGTEVKREPVGMAYRAFHTNRESSMEIQPFVTRFGHMLAWDGRLDNRDDLLAYLPDGLKGDETDVALVMAAYLKWGREFLLRIIGDVALALFDPASEAVLLGRDPFGTRTLYYSSNNNRIVWSSTLEALLVSARIEPDIDDEYVAGYLGLYREMFRSPYRHISAVEPGHVVEVRRGHVQTQRFWKPNPTREILYKTDAEYEEHFRELLYEGVRCRLRADGPVWLELSGGLDSSSNVCVADQIMERGEVQAARLETVSYIDNESSTSYDRKFIPLVEEKRRKPGHHLHGDGQWLRLISPEEMHIAKPGTGLCVAGGHERLCQAMQDDGARVLLSGLGGDQLLWSLSEASPELTDLVFKHRPLLLHRRLQVWSAILKKPYSRLLWEDALLPFFPISVKARIQSRIETPPWLNSTFIKRTSLRERLLLPPDPLGYRLPSRKIQSSKLHFIVSSIASGEYWESSPFEMSYPFLHRPLVEFLLAIPFEQKLRPGETRSLMRRALRDVLPQKILQRRSKGITGETLCRGIAKEWQTLKLMLDKAHILERGYVNQKALIAALDLARHGRELNIVALLETISLELWLRSIECHGVSVQTAPTSRDAPRTRDSILHVSKQLNPTGPLTHQSTKVAYTTNARYS